MTDKLSFKQRLLGLQGNLFNFACQLTSNPDAAQDLVQDTTLKVLDNESKYVDNVNFKGWVFTIMRNMYLAGYKYNEIAEKMSLPLGTVKSRIFFARKRLQGLLKDYR